MNNNQQKFLSKFGDGEHIDHLLDIDTVHKDLIAVNPHTEERHIDKMADSTEPYVQAAVIRHKKVKPEHLHKIIDNNKYSRHPVSTIHNMAHSTLQDLSSR